MGRWKRTLVLVASIVLAVAIVLQLRDGAGGMSADERLADSLCAAATLTNRVWFDLVKQVEQTRASPGREFRWEPLHGHALYARGIAVDYRDFVRAIEPPDTPVGRKAAKWLDYVAQRPLDHANQMVKWVRALPRNLTLLQSVRSLERMERELFGIYVFSGEVPLWHAVVPEFVDSFEAAESCKEEEDEDDPREE